VFQTVFSAIRSVVDLALVTSGLVAAVSSLSSLLNLRSIDWGDPRGWGEGVKGIFFSFFGGERARVEERVGECKPLSLRETGGEREREAEVNMDREGT